MPTMLDLFLLSSILKWLHKNLPVLINFNVQLQTLFFGAPKSLQMVNAAMKLKDAYSWKESYDQPRQHIKKQRHYFVNKSLSSLGLQGDPTSPS